MLDHIIPLLEVFAKSEIWTFVLWDIFGLLFICTVPSFIRGFWRK